MKIKTFAIVVALAAPAWAAPPEKTPPSTTDKEKPATESKLTDAEQQELMHLHKVNQHEIDMGKLAQQNGTAQIKTFANTLVSDHQKIDRDLTALAKKKGVTLTSMTPSASSADADAQEMKDMMADKDRLKTMKGKDFDKEFLSMTIAGHTKEIARLETSIAAAKDADVVSFLKNVRPVLQKHVDNARDIQKKVEAQASK